MDYVHLISHSVTFIDKTMGIMKNNERNMHETWFIRFMQILIVRYINVWYIPSMRSTGRILIRQIV